MSEILLPTQEVGSLAKPDWRVQTINQNLVTDAHFEQAEQWGDRLGIKSDELVEVLHSAERQINKFGVILPPNREALKQWSARYAIRLQEQAGIDIVYDGEQDRPEMYQVAVEGTRGFDWRGRVRAFDNRSYKKAAVVGGVALKHPWHTDEYERAFKFAEHPLKVPITGAYTIADWSFDEYYQKQQERGGLGLDRIQAKEQFVLDLADNVIRPNVQSLLDAGATWIQIDEPAATTKPEEVPLFIESFNRSVAGLVGKFGVHICFSDYNLLFPHIEKIENCDQFSLEFANRDPRGLGVDSAARPAYETLEKFKIWTPEVAIGLGVTSVHDSLTETPQLVRDRVLHAVDIIGDPAKIYPSPDCGLRTRSWGDAYDKLAATAEGTQLARQVL